MKKAAIAQHHPEAAVPQLLPLTLCVCVHRLQVGLFARGDAGPNLCVPPGAV